VFVGFSPTSAGQLWIRSLDTPEARALPGTEGASRPFWSPDGTAIAFSAGDELRKVLLASGAVQRVCALPRPDSGGGGGGVWSAEGTIVFSENQQDSRLYLVPAAGGEAKVLTPLDESRGETGHYVTDLLPDGRHLLVEVDSTDAEHDGLHVISLDAPQERRRVLPERGRFLYAPEGYLLAVRSGLLTAQHFDAEDLVVTGEPVPIASGVASWVIDPSWGSFSVSAAGRVAWLSGQRRDVRLEWVDREGQPVGTLGEPGSYSQIALSPDDRKLAVEVPDAEGRYDLWVMDVARGVASRLTTDPENERDPVWSPDGEALVFSSDAGGDQDLVLKRLQDPGPAAPLPEAVGQTPGERDIAESWSREGDTLLFVTIGQERTLWTLPMEGGAPPEPLKQNRFAIDEPQVSADGRWIAYISQESGRYEVYVAPFGRRGETVRVSTGGGGQPKWRGDGKELFYLSPDGALMAVDVRGGENGADVGLPTTLVPARDLRAVTQGPDYDDYAVTSDGQRFLIKRPVDGDSRQRIHVLLDWPSVLEPR
jgi:Tol biopolymer transport system component